MPLGAETGDGEAIPEYDDLVSMLAAGFKDEAIARKLRLSTRTLDRRISSLMKTLDATTRFQAGGARDRRAVRHRDPLEQVSRRRRPTAAPDVVIEALVVRQQEELARARVAASALRDTARTLARLTNRGNEIERRSDGRVRLDQLGWWRFYDMSSSRRANPCSEQCRNG